MPCFACMTPPPAFQTEIEKENETRVSKVVTREAAPRAWWTGPAAAGWPLCLQPRVHLLHDFAMASKMATSCHVPRSRSKLRLSPYDCSGFKFEYIYPNCTQTHVVLTVHVPRPQIYIILNGTPCCYTGNERCFALLSSSSRLVQTTRKGAKVVFGFCPRTLRRPRSSAVRPSARPSVQNLSARNFRLNNAMVACSTALNLHLSSSHALKSESVCV